MRKIDEILSVEKHLDPKTKKFYFITTAVVGGDEVTGWSKTKDEFQVGQEVECFFDDKWHKAKMAKGKSA